MPVFNISTFSRFPTNLLQRQSDALLLSRPGVKVEHNIVLVLCPPEEKKTMSVRDNYRKGQRLPLNPLDLVVDVVDEAFDF